LVVGESSGAEMIKLFDLKKTQEKEKGTALAGGKKIAPGTIRMQKDIGELKLEKNVTIEFPNGVDDLMNFKITIAPSDGIYCGGRFVFEFKVPSSYPHDAPKVHCETPVYHPNIDMEGHVCLNILREDWKPVLTIQSIVMGLQFLMCDPNPDDPLNKEAADALSHNKDKFTHIVKETLRGKSLLVGGTRYEFQKFL